MNNITQVPHVNFRVRELGDWVDTNTDTYFKGKKVVVFSLPGAFTPTCSNQQLPGFEKQADVFKAHGIDEIYCVSVNDSFVMNAWAADQKLKNVKVIPDGNGQFTQEMGMLCQKRDKCFGERSWRYAMIVNISIHFLVKTRHKDLQVCRLPYLVQQTSFLLHHCLQS